MKCFAPMKQSKPSLRLITLILGTLCTISPFSIDMYLPAFPQIAQRFGVDVPQVSLTIASYFIGLAAGQLLYGPFLDRFGRKPPLLVGLALYIVASVLCIFAPTFNFLVGVRVLQALGACGASVACMAMVRDFFPPLEGAKVFSRLMLILSVSPMFAPTIGSFLIVLWGWQSVFVALVLIVLLICSLVIFVLPEGHGGDADHSLRPVSIVKTYWRITRHRQFLSYALAGGFSFSGLFAYVAGSPAIFLSKFHLSERMFGLVFAFLSVGVIGGGQINVHLIKKHDGEKIFRLALFSQLVVAALFLSLVRFTECGLIAHILLLFTYLSCVGLTYPNAAAIALTPFDKHAGSASAMLGMLQMTVGALVSAAFGVMQLPVSISVSALFFFTSIIGALILMWGTRVRVMQPSA
jgi:DHA1 family bicyclomycin/chloramphenicol resistance-like MFS transporter